MEAENPVQEEVLFSESNLETAIVNKAVFTGDTVFIGGVGKFFEGTAKEMARNIAWIKSLPPQTQIFCGHDYVESSTKFAKGIEPENPAYDEELKRLQDNAIAGTHQLPSSVFQQCKSNVFFRHDILCEKFKVNDPIECLQILRDYKDNGQKL